MDSLVVNPYGTKGRGILGLVILAAVLLGGCEMITGTDLDVTGPTVNAEITGSELYVEAFDFASEVVLVEIWVDGTMFAAFTSDFRSIDLSLKGLGYGTFKLTIAARDGKGNTTWRYLSYANEAYVSTERVAGSRLEPVWDTWGCLIANVRIIRMEINWTPILSGIPDKETEVYFRYELTNLTPHIFYGATLTVSGFDSRDNLLWSHIGYPGTIYPGYMKSFNSDTDIYPDSDRYAISLYWY